MRSLPLMAILVLGSIPRVAPAATSGASLPASRSILGRLVGLMSRDQTAPSEGHRVVRSLGRYTSVMPLKRTGWLKAKRQNLVQSSIDRDRHVTVFDLVRMADGH